MNEDTKNLMIANIVSGILANPNVFEIYKDETCNGANIEDCIVRDATIYVEKILAVKSETSETTEKRPKRAQTGILDATGRQILDGDIIVYTKWWSAKGIEHKNEILKDLISNYDKYEEKISLHPVFWDDDLHVFCTDIYSDVDPLYKIDPQYVYVVSNNIEHPELYNY